MSFFDKLAGVVKVVTKVADVAVTVGKVAVPIVSIVNPPIGAVLTTVFSGILAAEGLSVPGETKKELVLASTASKLAADHPNLEINPEVLSALIDAIVEALNKKSTELKSVH